MASLCQLVPREIFRDALSSILGTSELSSVFGSAGLHQFSQVETTKDTVLYRSGTKMSWNRVKCWVALAAY